MGPLIVEYRGQWAYRFTDSTENGAKMNHPVDTLIDNYLLEIPEV